MVLAATLAHAHRWRHLTQLNLCRPYLRNPFDDFTAARTDDTTPDGHELQWFWLRLLLMLTGGATLHNYTCVRPSITNLCSPYLCKAFTDFIAARRGDTTPDGHELQWFWL